MSLGPKEFTRNKKHGLLTTFRRSRKRSLITWMTPAKTRIRGIILSKIKSVIGALRRIMISEMIMLMNFSHTMLDSILNLELLRGTILAIKMMIQGRLSNLTVPWK